MYSADDFKIVKTKVLRPIDNDRANATSNLVIMETIQRLKINHEHIYRSHHQNWALWATKICRTHDPTREPESYERALRLGPDASIIHLFTRAPEPADSVLENVRQNVSIARSINTNFTEEVTILKDLLKKAVEKQKEQADLLSEISTRVDAMDIGATARSTLLSDMGDAV